ncbi:hypothetical protein [Burkholderia sp. D-99]|uniref:hypothetical protein n=1 Tax=Burkholderia sp. D-99 TaxID=2717316 RepID=UPI00141E527A|nr:hypothetical protein [Burkholderia sp. D-99]NHV25893.1 hypothetical protein [Burkholderia sp. D-99]
MATLRPLVAMVQKRCPRFSARPGRRVGRFTGGNASSAATQPITHWDFVLKRACASASVGVVVSAATRDGLPRALRVATTVHIAGHAYCVHYIRDADGMIRREHVLASGIACVWLAALDLFGARFTYSKPTEAAFELQAWFEGAGANTHAGQFVRHIEKHLAGIVAAEAMTFDAERRTVSAV